MRSNRTARRARAVGALALVVLAWAGCSGKKQTELVAGVTSQVQVPRDFRTVRIDVNAAFGNAFCRTYPVYDGKVRLPRTLGVVAGGDPNAPVTITVAGYVQDSQDGAVQAFNDCSAIPAVGTTSRGLDRGGGARVLRRSRQPYVANKILYLPMPLRYSCYDVDCEQDRSDPCKGGDCTCRGGRCVPPDVDPTQLFEYTDDLVFGTTNTCFRPFSNQDDQGNVRAGCLDDGVPPQVVDGAKCIFALPDTPSSPPYDGGIPRGTDSNGNPLPLTHGAGLNVRVVYDDVVSEVLDAEGACPADGSGAKEGYCIPDASKPQQYQLAPGLCDELHAASDASVAAPHRITLMTASGLCPSKTENQPICDDTIQGAPAPTLLDGGTSADGGCNVALPLTPAPSALYLLMDKSSGMRDFFGQNVFAQVIGIPLQDPVFSETQIAFKYLPASAADCTASPNAFATLDPKKGDIPFESSFKAQADIAASIASIAPDAGAATFPPGTDPWYLEAALSAGGAYKALTNLQASTKTSFNKLAVMLLIDRDFPVGAANQCGGAHPDALQEAAQAYASQGITTYVVFLKNADYPSGGVPQTDTTNASKLAQSGNTTFFDATGDNLAQVEADALNTVVADLSGCVYEARAGVGAGSTVSFFDPVSQSEIHAVNATSCAAETTGSLLWTFDGTRVRMCPNTCNVLRNAIKADEAFTEAQNLQNGTSNAARGITVTSLDPCEGSSGGDASAGVDATAPARDAGGTSTGDGSSSADGGASVDAAFGGDASAIADAATGG